MKQPVNHFFRYLKHSRHLLPSVLTGYLWFKGQWPQLPFWSCPVRALTGVPCPTCFLTRATSAALTGNLTESLHEHAFGPVVAAGLLGWSLLAIHKRQLLPGRLPAQSLGWIAAALLGYWALRLGLDTGLNLRTFPK